VQSRQNNIAQLKITRYALGISNNFRINGSRRACACSMRSIFSGTGTAAGVAGAGWNKFCTRFNNVVVDAFGAPGLGDRVICISQFTADEAIRCLDLAPSLIEVVHNGCDFRPDVVPPERAPDFDVSQDFYLFVGSLEPVKNLRLLRAVYELASGRGLTLPPLVIVGARWLGVVGEGSPPPGWLYAGRQDDEVLVHLYRRALALVFPTVYEGFGFPLVEAMALGCPVICSPVASLPELGGDAPIYADQTPGAYLDAMLGVANDPVRRDDHIAAGRLRATRYTWERCAEETLAVYREVGQA
jgi:alpha-1,3-rhamnosyl/mannosyltransferase